jgi:hypothetical protein
MSNDAPGVQLCRPRTSFGCSCLESTNETVTSFSYTSLCASSIRSAKLENTHLPRLYGNA